MSLETVSYSPTLVSSRPPIPSFNPSSLVSMQALDKFYLYRDIALNVTNLLALFIFVFIEIFRLAELKDAAHNSMLIHIYLCIFGILLFANEVRSQPTIINHFLFLCTLRGRGILYLGFGSIAVGPTLLYFVVSLILLGFGFTSFFLSFSQHPPGLKDSFSLYCKWKSIKEGSF